MDIKKILSDYHKASDLEKLEIEESIKNDYALLSDDEKKEVQRIFLESRDEIIRQGKIAIKELTLKSELERVSQYISMSYIAKNYFGKSRQWLNNRIKGNTVNGKPVVFTGNELKQLSSALDNLSIEIKDTALRISN